MRRGPRAICIINNRCKPKPRRPPQTQLTLPTTRNANPTARRRDRTNTSNAESNLMKGAARSSLHPFAKPPSPGFGSDIARLHSYSCSLSRTRFSEISWTTPTFFTPKARRIPECRKPPFAFVRSASLNKLPTTVCSLVKRFLGGLKGLDAAARPGLAPPPCATATARQS